MLTFQLITCSTAHKIEYVATFVKAYFEIDTVVNNINFSPKHNENSRFTSQVTQLTTISFFSIRSCTTISKVSSLCVTRNV